MDKQLPESFTFDGNTDFGPSYFTELHSKVSQNSTYNFQGARIKLIHSKIRVDRIRELLPYQYDDISVIQYLEFGFPLGLAESPVLESTLKNHSSSYDYFKHIDKFLDTEIKKGGATGPFLNSPFEEIMLSPLMTR